MKRIHKEGITIIVTTLVVVLLIVLAIVLVHPQQTIWHYITYLVLAIFCSWTICFFRIPVRAINKVENGVLAPADGEVVANEIVVENEYFHDERIQISIFMSIYNVHVNWFPMDGEVSYQRYHPGDFLVAYKPKSSTENERNTLVVKDAQGREVLVRQIAGFVARRIVTCVDEGSPAHAGEEFGMIRFGSRLDVFLPVDSDIKVKIGDKTKGKQTILALLK